MPASEEQIAQELKAEIITQMNIQFDVQDSGKMDKYAEAMANAIAKTIVENLSQGGV
jgi:hypothetical protein